MFLGICSIIKNESENLLEWIHFHLLQGVERFFLYDNDSTDDTKKVLKPYINEGLITLYHWPYSPGQISAYNHFIKNYYLLPYRLQYIWCLFIDVDEFCYSVDSLLPSAISHIVKEDTSVIAANWLLFGSNGHETKPDGLVIENYTRRGLVNGHVKSIVRVKDAIECLTPHAFKVTGKIVNEYGHELPEYYSITERPSADILRINHYHVRSKQEYIEKCQKPRADNNQKRDFESSWIAHDVNEIEDLYVTQFSERIKENIKRRCSLT